MATWQSNLRKIEAAERRNEREAVKARKELERRRKEIAKSDEQAQAGFEVEAFENELDVLLSIHKDSADDVDWMGVFAALPPPAPAKLARRHLAATFRASLLPESEGSGEIDAAVREDSAIHDAGTKAGIEELARWEHYHKLAERVLSGDLSSYSLALSDFAPFSEIDQLGSSLAFVVPSQRMIECTLTVNGQHVIPRSVKSLTASRKLSVKTMPKGRFHEIYQDYVCGSAIRVARELFALLPVSDVIVTAVIDETDPASGASFQLPVLSVHFDRERFLGLHFDRLDPSDSMCLFQTRGDVMASRRTGAFSQIDPLTPTDLHAAPLTRQSSLAHLITRARELRNDIGALSSKIRIPDVNPALQ